MQLISASTALKSKSANQNTALLCLLRLLATSLLVLTPPGWLREGYAEGILLTWRINMVFGLWSQTTKATRPRSALGDLLFFAVAFIDLIIKRNPG